MAASLSKCFHIGSGCKFASAGIMTRSIGLKASSYRTARTRWRALCYKCNPNNVRIALEPRKGRSVNPTSWEANAAVVQFSEISGAASARTSCHEGPQRQLRSNPMPRPDQITGTSARLVRFGSAAGVWAGLDRTACISAQE